MKKKFNWTKSIKIADVFEIYKDVNTKTREFKTKDGKIIKLPDGGVRLRFLGKVPSWYAQREKIYQEIFGDLTSDAPNPLEKFLQDKNNQFGGLYVMSDDLYPECNGGAYLGIGTSTKKSTGGNDPFGGGSISRIWKHLLKMLGRHESCKVQRPEYWTDHVENRNAGLCDPLCNDVKFSFWIDYDHSKEELEKVEDAMQDHRLGKYSKKFPVNKHPASPLTNFERLPI